MLIIINCAVSITNNKEVWSEAYIISAIPKTEDTVSKKTLIETGRPVLHASVEQQPTAQSKLSASLRISQVLLLESQRL